MAHLPVILFEPDGYVLDGPKLMGRQAAGHGFLRAAIAEAESSSGDSSLFAWTPFQASARVFDQVVRHHSETVRPAWIPTCRPDHLAKRGALYLPGPGLADAARQRLRSGPAAWSVSGVTHTLCSHGAMDAIVDIIAAPVMPWDALICTSRVAHSAVKTLFQLQADYLAWRFGVSAFSIPQLPVIPLGVHAGDFIFSNKDKIKARQALDVAPDEVVVLFAGRLSFHAKAHPFPMLSALNESVRQTQKKVTLVLCGQFPNEAVHKAFIEAAKQYAPMVKTMWVDGKDPEAYNRAWAASDIFVSLADNLQETFGITPIEAMASALPVLVTDWDGYKDTVIDGETGFRIPTWMPPPDIGMSLAAAFEAGTINYDRYIGLACMEVSIDNAMLVNRLVTLVADPALRARMGAAGRRRVEQVYDWSIVIKQYQSLWQELDLIRKKAAVEQCQLLNAAPKCAPGRQDPYRIFASFPTHLLGPDTSVSLSQGLWPLTSWKNLAADPLFSYAQDFLPNETIVDWIMALLSDKVLSVAQLAESAGIPMAQVIRILSPLAKVGMVILTEKHTKTDSGCL